MIAISRFDVAGESAMFLDVSCTSPSLDGVFAELAEEVLHRVEAGQSPVRAVASTMDDFRRLLQEVQPFDIGEQQIVGLLGELVVLRSLVEIAPAATRSIWSRSARAAARFPSSRARRRGQNRHSGRRHQDFDQQRRPACRASARHADACACHHGKS